MPGLFSDLSEYRKTEQSLTIQRDQYDDLRESSREERRMRKKARRAELQRQQREENQDFLDSNEDIRNLLTAQERLDYYKSGVLPERISNKPVSASAPAPVFDMAAFADMIGKAVKTAVDEALA